MEQTILKDLQVRALDLILQEPNLSSFYLSGGTALAGYYFFHRISDDLDFFCFEDPDKLFLHHFSLNLKTQLNAQSLRYERLYDRNQFFLEFDNSELKLEFTKYPFSQLGNPTLRNGLKIDSLRDIAANKLMTILDRFDPKDFVDFFFLLQQFNLEEIRKDTEKKFGIKIDDIFLGGELSKVKRIQILPKMIKPLSIKELRDAFSKLIRKLEPNILE